MRSKMSAFKRPVLLVGLPSSANFLLPCWCMRRQRTLQHFGADIEFHFRRTSYIQSDCGSETWLCLMDLMWRTGHCAISRSCWSSKANAWQIILGFPFPPALADHAEQQPMLIARELDYDAAQLQESVVAQTAMLNADQQYVY